MATDYDSIEREHVRRYGTDIGELGELFFSQLYTERTHFIYELLQNAEDALQRRSIKHSGDNFPRSVAFRLFRDRLELSHYGIPFSEEDVRGICGILRGTKTGDLTQIGKFGIGFKSVYVYTAMPNIHSADEHFRIRDFVRPQAIPAASLSPGETLFTLRFDRSDVSQETAFQEIAARLETLSLRTLLFLRQIDQIAWEVEGGRHGAFLRKSQAVSQTVRKALLSGARDKDDNHEEWLVFQRPVRTDSGKDLPVEIAFLLRKERGAARQSVAPLNESNLVVFFPTDKETHVGFLIQGPYRTTLSRDNVPSDDSWNSTLASETASLLADSLAGLRDMGLIDIDLLKALPIRVDDFPESFMFRLLFDKVRKAFRETDLLPNSDGSCRPAPRLKLARPTGLRELLSSKQLTQLYEADVPLEWLHEELSSDRNHSVYGYLTNELEIEVVTPSDVAQLLSREFLEAQSDEWVIRFYGFLQEQEALWREGRRGKASGPLRSKPIIRLEDGTHVAPFTDDDHSQAYLPSEHKSHFPTVKRNVAKDKDALAFLRRLGLRKPDATAEVLEHVIPRYIETVEWQASDETLLEDLKLIVEAWRTDSTKVRNKLQERLRASYFVPSLNPATGERTLTRPGEAYCHSVELETYFVSSTSTRFVQQVLPADLQEEFDGFLRSLGVAAEPRRIEFEPDLTREERRRLRGGTRITGWRVEELKDYDLDGLHVFLDRLPTLSIELATGHSRILWDFLRAHENENDWFRGSYSWFHYNSWSKEFPAKFLKALREKPWLPGSDGRLHRPAGLTVNDLPDDFQKSQKLAEHLELRSDKLSELAAQLNVDEEALVLLREHPEEWKQFVKQLKRAKETPVEGPVASQKSKSSVEVDSGRPVSAGGTSADTGPSIDRPSEEADGDEVIVPDPGEPREGSKRLPVIVATGETGAREHHSGAGPNNEVARAGVKKVLQYEAEHGRQPKEMPHTNEGFDIKSWDPVKNVMRFIEVKSTSEDWGAANIALSAPQFRFGMKVEPAQEFWLYVVERAGREDAEIRCIPNPAGRATHFIYPAGWSRLEADESDGGES